MVAELGWSAPDNVRSGRAPAAALIVKRPFAEEQESAVAGRDLQLAKANTGADILVFESGAGAPGKA